jgi:hypothetical protein
MNDESALRIAALEQKVAALEALLAQEVARLDKRIQVDQDGVGYYIDKHGRHHAEIARMLIPAYYKTHPEAVATLMECDKILGQPKDDGSDPQP